MDLGDEWRVCEAWSDASVQQVHGVYLLHRDGLQVHVAKHAGLVPRTMDGLQALLHRQNWASAPYDVAVADGEPMMASALFKMLPRGVVLEGFVTDRRQFANLVMSGPSDAVLATRPAAERLVSSLRFEAE